MTRTKTPSAKFGAATPAQDRSRGSSASDSASSSKTSPAVDAKNQAKSEQKDQRKAQEAAVRAQRMMGKRIPSKQNFVLVGSLDPRITAAQLQSHFASCGSISAVRMSYAGNTGVSATVEFEQPAGAKKALRLSRSTVADFDDRPIKVVMNVLHMEEIHHRPSATAVAHALTSDTLYLAQHVPQKAEIIVKPPFVPVPGERHEHLTGETTCAGDSLECHLIVLVQGLGSVFFPMSLGPRWLIGRLNELTVDARRLNRPCTMGWYSELKSSALQYLRPVCHSAFIQESPHRPSITIT
ncbi:unnamed protein product [Mycena citricolor]|uniref:RRM domain-containing protein n=1 Tax=Mycena citricolor TaxID=2018698 RepID=A0AAD2HXN5_9AGAR|nr:unnamed protein product [Mycena citricolor]CAK5283755.1 unnamed protein product [Mycena citricolor]